MNGIRQYNSVSGRRLCDIIQAASCPGSKAVTAQDRQKEMSAYLAERGSLADLLARFAVSEATARRDLQDMQQRGLLRRTRGGAYYVGTREHPLSYAIREGRFTRAKEEIGRVVAEMVRDGDSLILDGGTTTYQVARRLRGRPLQVVTNSLPIANLLGNAPVTELVFLGGYIMPQAGVALGPHAENMLRSLNVRLAIMGTAGITEEGLFNSHLLMVEVERLMMQSAEEVVIAVDHSKFGRKSMAKLCELGEFKYLVSDDELESRWVNLLQSRGTEVRLAPTADSADDGPGETP